MKLIGFWETNDEFGYMSNWYRAEFDYDGHHFVNSEQAFMYLKAKLFNDTESMQKILENTNPLRCKQLGRNVKPFDSNIFDKHKYQFMVQVVYEKFSQNEYLKVKLLNTKDAILVEASPRDNIWGIGIDVNHQNFNDPNKWPGQNLLGKALMEVREKLNNHF